VALLCPIAGAQVWVPYEMVCSYAAGSQAGPLQQPVAQALHDVRTVTSVLRILPIAVYEGDVDNAAAVMIPQIAPMPRGWAPVTRWMPAIIYNRSFMAWIDAQGSWAALSVMAHEVGHHVNHDSTWYGQFKHPWTKELQADFISGYVLARLGAPLEEAVRAQQAMCDLTGTLTHPDTPRRIDAIEQGWLRGGGHGAFRQMFYELR